MERQTSKTFVIRQMQVATTAGQTETIPRLKKSKQMTNFVRKVMMQTGVEMMSTIFCENRPSSRDE